MRRTCLARVSALWWGQQRSESRGGAAAVGLAQDGAEVDAVDVAREDLAAGGEAPAVVVDPEAEPMGGLDPRERAAAHGPDDRPGLGGGALRHRRVEGGHAGGRGVTLGIGLVGAAFAQKQEPVPGALDLRLAAQAQGGRRGPPRTPGAPWRWRPSACRGCRAGGRPAAPPRPRPPRRDRGAWAEDRALSGPALRPGAGLGAPAPPGLSPGSGRGWSGRRP